MVEGCSCSINNPRVIWFYRAHWKNGRTDFQVRQLSRGYRVIEHCCEHHTRDGTGISTITRNFEGALVLARAMRDVTEKTAPIYAEPIVRQTEGGAE